MNTLILNQHSSNFGDDVTGCVLVELLLKKKKVSRVDILYNAEKTIPVTNKRVYHHLEQNFSNVGYLNIIKYYIIQKTLGLLPKNKILRDWILLLRNADLVFVTPCGANIGIYKDWRFLFRVLMAVIENKKPIFHYNTIGKSGNFIFDLIAKYVLKHSKIYVREKASQNYVRSLGLECKCGPDTAFALKPLNLEVDRNLICFIPSQLATWHPLFKNITSDEHILNKILPAIVDFANKNHFRIEILPHLGTDPENRFDQKVLTIMRNLGCKSVSVRNDICNYIEYDKAIARSRFIIGMRYHAVVLSAKNMRPFISISYENKMKEVCKYTNCIKQSVDLTDFNNFNCIELETALNYTFINEYHIIENIKKVLPNLRKLAMLPTDENIKS